MNPHNKLEYERFVSKILKEEGATITRVIELKETEGFICFSQNIKKLYINIGGDFVSLNYSDIKSVKADKGIISHGKTVEYKTKNNHLLTAIGALAGYFVFSAKTKAVIKDKTHDVDCVKIQTYSDPFNHIFIQCQDNFEANAVKNVIDSETRKCRKSEDVRKEIEEEENRLKRKKINIFIIVATLICAVTYYFLAIQKHTDYYFIEYLDKSFIEYDLSAIKESKDTIIKQQLTEDTYHTFIREKRTGINILHSEAKNNYLIAIEKKDTLNAIRSYCNYNKKYVVAEVKYTTIDKFDSHFTETIKYRVINNETGNNSLGGGEIMSFEITDTLSFFPMNLENDLK